MNTGHGHVYPREDGAKARCGGPAICRECANDLGQQQSEAMSKLNNYLLNSGMQTAIPDCGNEIHSAHVKHEQEEKLERLRDEFAMHAPEMSTEWFETSGFKTKMPARAAWAYEYADAALKAREIK